ncbi:MAG: hypothetical protein LC662_09765 [Rhodothermaceae bacterium]|nr:hypothetical protein [Rhodothermaceae bacterium]
MFIISYAFKHNNSNHINDTGEGEPVSAKGREVEADYVYVMEFTSFAVLRGYQY